MGNVPQLVESGKKDRLMLDEEVGQGSPPPGVEDLGY